MALFPISINSLNFYVNPTNLSVTKPLLFSQVPTVGGLVYQAWYDAPETFVLSGESAGSTAYNELVFLRQNFENTNKVVTIGYKAKVYYGFMNSISLEHSTSHINRFRYNIQITLLQGQHFAIEDTALNANNQGLIEGAVNSAANFINQKLGLANIQTQIQSTIAKI
jgi:hypothetical protein